MGDSVPVMEIKYVMKEGYDEVVESVEVRKKKGRGRAFLFNVSFRVPSNERRCTDLTTRRPHKKANNVPTEHA